MSEKQDEKSRISCSRLLAFIAPVIGVPIGSVLGSYAAFSFLLEYVFRSDFLGIGAVIFSAVFFVVGLIAGAIILNLAYRFGLGTYLANRFGNGVSTFLMFLTGLVGGFLVPLLTCWFVIWLKRH